MEERNIKVWERSEYEEVLFKASLVLIVVWVVIMVTNLNSYEKGHREGHREGHKEGYIEGYKEGHKLRIDDGKDLVPELIEGVNKGKGEGR